MISPNAFSNNILSQRKGAQDLPDSSAAAVVASDSRASAHTAKPTTVHVLVGAKVPTNTCNETPHDLPTRTKCPLRSRDARDQQLDGVSHSHHNIVRYSPYPPFAPLPPPASATLSSVSSSSTSSADQTPKPPTSTFCQDFVSSCLGTSTNLTRHVRSASGSTGTTKYKSSQTITPMAGAGTKTYVINDLGRLTCTPGIAKAKKITPTILGTPERIGGAPSFGNIVDHDDLPHVVDDDKKDDDNSSVSSLEIANHTRTVADALAYAGISTVVVSGQPKCLFRDGSSTASDGGDADLSATKAKALSGCRGLLAKFNEVDAEAPMLGECRPSASSSSQYSDTSTSSGEVEHDNGDYTSNIPCDEDGLNLGDEMNTERKADTAKWKKKVGQKNAKGRRKKPRRLAPRKAEGC